MRFNSNYKFYFKYLLTIGSIVGGYLFLIWGNEYGLLNQHTTLCIFKRITTIPCPGCGMGRASLELLHGHIVKSFHYNILSIPFTIAIIAALIWMGLDLYQKRESFFEFMQKEVKTKYKILLIVIILIDWTANIVRGI